MKKTGELDSQRKNDGTGIGSSLLNDLQESWLVDQAAAKDGFSAVPGSLLEVGTIIDNYFVIRSLGTGGMAQVYLARDIKLGRRVALKLIRRDQLKGKDLTERFLFEARTTAKFNNPHIVTIYSVGEYQGNPYLALEYVEGQTLRQRMLLEQLSSKSAARIGLAISRALEAAHSQGLLHRDIKPENVLLGKDGIVRLADFGLAAFVGQEVTQEVSKGQENTQEVFNTLHIAKGTPQYMAPEQWLGEDVGPWSDIWALGLTLYEMNTNQHPYRGINDHKKLRDAVCDTQRAVGFPDCGGQADRELVQLLKKCLSKQARLRPEAKEVADTLERYLRGQAKILTSQNPIRGLLPYKKEQRTNPYIFLILFCGLFLSGVGLWSWMFGEKTEMVKSTKKPTQLLMTQNNLFVQTEPKNADILINGRMVGRTGQKGVALRIGPGKTTILVIQKKGYEDYTVEVKGSSMRGSTINAVLTKQPNKRNPKSKSTQYRKKVLKAALTTSKDSKPKLHKSMDLKTDEEPKLDRHVPLIEDELDLLPMESEDAHNSLLTERSSTFQ